MLKNKINFYGNVNYLVLIILHGSICCRMRHGKIGLQLGRHQKYYISRCQEKKSIQLTITVSRNDAKCVKKRAELIVHVAKVLTDIMKVFMPAAKRPVLFVPCPLCPIIHITVKQVYEGYTVFCPSSGDDSIPPGYYSDLLPTPLTGETNHK